MNQLKKNHRAFVAIDMLFGIIVVGGVTISLVGTARYEQTAEMKLADSRSAVHLAEHALLNLQHGQPIPAAPVEAQLTFQPVTDGTAPAGYIWVKVTASIHRNHQSLLGVVPIASVPQAELKP